MAHVQCGTDEEGRSTWFRIVLSEPDERDTAELIQISKAELSGSTPRRVRDLMNLLDTAQEALNFL